MLYTSVYRGGFGRIYDHGNRNARRTSERRPRGRKIEIIGKLLYTTDRPGIGFSCVSNILYYYYYYCYIAVPSVLQ